MEGLNMAMQLLERPVTDEQIQQQHYSARLGRNYVDTDLLSRDEVAQVAGANGGKLPAQPRYMNDILRRRVAAGLLHPQRVQNVLLYPYVEIKSLTVGARVG